MRIIHLNLFSAFLLVPMLALAMDDAQIARDRISRLLNYKTRTKVQEELALSLTERIKGAASMRKETGSRRAFSEDLATFGAVRFKVEVLKKKEAAKPSQKIAAIVQITDEEKAASMAELDKLMFELDSFNPGNPFAEMPNPFTDTEPILPVECEPVSIGASQHDMTRIEQIVRDVATRAEVFASNKTVPSDFPSLLVALNVISDNLNISQLNNPGKKAAKRILNFTKEMQERNVGWSQQDGGLTTDTAFVAYKLALQSLSEALTQN